MVNNYIPKEAIPLVEYLIQKYNVNLKIVNQRKTKHGDFKVFHNGKTQITVNNNLNKHQFLLTLVHEIAHQVTHIRFGSVKAHGMEWKTVFQHLMLPFLNPNIFPKEVLPTLANYLKNPKASTDSDPKLSIALRGYKASNGKSFVFELPKGAIFKFKNNEFKLGKKRRTRYECLNLTNKKVYLFNQNAEVIFYE